jgi:phytoene dehydrogenase-like protein
MISVLLLSLLQLLGYTYEMGGTWVSHFQPNLFREMQRYDMDRDLVTTRQGMYENNYYTMNLTGKSS